MITRHWRLPATAAGALVVALPAKREAVILMVAVSNELQPSRRSAERVARTANEPG